MQKEGNYQEKKKQNFNFKFVISGLIVIYHLIDMRVYKKKRS